jgi:hypothetical protein
MIPIFILTCDRLECLKKSLQSYYDCIKTPFEIIVIDFGTTFTNTIDYINSLEENGTKVYRMDKIYKPSELNMANNCIQDYFSTHIGSNYIVTDPDVELDRTNGDILDVYSYFLEANPAINVVGPMLRIDDIPDWYPYKKGIMDGTMGLHKKFHSLPINKIIYNDNEIKYVSAPIDTTFGMYKMRDSWQRLRHGARVLSPYSARHLDWYINFNDLTPDQEYYMNNSSDSITNWSKLEKKYV